MDMNFDEIRCYNDNEIHDALSRLSDEKQFMKVLSTVYPLMPKEVLRKRLLSFTSSYEFQKEMVNPFLQYLEANMTKGIRLFGLEKLNDLPACLYISNHRDIILDSALLCNKLIEDGRDTVEIAIGDNLLIFPWIEELVRVNKSFIVKRGLSPRQILESSRLLSAYISFTLRTKHQSIWLAQREGRAKDSNDRTQESLLKMLNMSGSGTFIENMNQLNICPLSISYEYDPCDFLKAKEMLDRHNNPEFKKRPGDDLISMQTGVMGYKGRVAYRITGTINNDLKQFVNVTHDKNELIHLTAELIDHRIHAAYEIYPINKIAYDILQDKNRFADEYSNEEKDEFIKYIHHQLSKIQIDNNKDKDFLLLKLYEMYANPLINHLAATGK